jgi:hypothetical protein
MVQEQAQTLPVPPVPPTPGPHTVLVQTTPLPPALPPWMALPPSVTLLITLGFFAACAVVFTPLARALARRIEGRGGADPALRSEIDQLRQRLEDVEGVQHRLLELEERVDFAERMLATQRRESERLPGA